jgi:hypothetical protein
LVTVSAPRARGELPKRCVEPAKRAGERHDASVHGSAGNTRSIASQHSTHSWSCSRAMHHDRWTNPDSSQWGQPKTTMIGHVKDAARSAFWPSLSSPNGSSLTVRPPQSGNSTNQGGRYKTSVRPPWLACGRNMNLG